MPRNTKTELPVTFAPLTVKITPAECKVALSWVGTGIEDANVEAVFKADVIASDEKPELKLRTMDKVN